jgi:diacylglycerol O-acyltransferase / wax synthase
MKSHPLSIVDQAFLLFETEASPKHVGGLFVFQKPADAPRTYVKQLYQELMERDEAIPPFNLKLAFSPRFVCCWRPVEVLDMEEHLFYHRLTARTTREDLFDFVGELHTPLLDRSRPLWECHVIDGLPGRRFGIYVKIHHAYGDGISFTQIFADSLRNKPAKTLDKIFWNTGRPFHYGKPEDLSSTEQLRQILKMLGAPPRALLGLSRITLLLWLERFGVTDNAIAVPFTAKRTALNGQVTSGRQVAAAEVSMERVARLRKRTRSTLNHIALTCIDGALHKYLNETGNAVDGPLTINMPVNLRTDSDEPGGNKLAIVLVELAPETHDPYVRLREIGVALRNVRYQVDTLPHSSVITFSVLTNVVALIAEAIGASDHLPPLGHTLVSNVAGPPDTLYLQDAELAEYYPISALPPGLHLNITLFSYGGHLNFGLVATKDSLPDLHRLATLIEEAFTELESAIDAAPEPPAKTKAKAKPKTKTKRKAKAKAKPKAKAKTKAKTKS